MRRGRGGVDRSSKNKPVTNLTDTQAKNRPAAGRQAGRYTHKHIQRNGQTDMYSPTLTPLTKPKAWRSSFSVCCAMTWL